MGRRKKVKKQMKRGRNAPAFAVSGIRDDVSYEVVFKLCLRKRLRKTGLEERECSNG